MGDKPAKRLSKSAATREALIDATDQLIQTDGFAGVTSRSVAAKAGVKPPLLHYHFKSMEDLLLEVFRRGSEADLEQLRLTSLSDDPLRAMWRLSSDTQAMRRITEFMAIANHIDAVRVEITHYAEQRRQLQADGLSRYLASRNIEPRIPPLVLACLMENVMRGQMLETSLGITLGHAETEAFIHACVEFFEEHGGTSLHVEGAPPKPTRRARLRASRKDARPWAARLRG